MASRDVEFQLQVQICRDIEGQPINDLMKEWPEDQFRNLGIIKFQAQQIIDSSSQELEHMSFNPFDNVETLLPTGRIQRTRLETYRAAHEARTTGPVLK